MRCSKNFRLERSPSSMIPIRRSIRTLSILPGEEDRKPSLIGGLGQLPLLWCSSCALDLHAGVGASATGLVVMRLASQRVSGNVSNIAANNRVIGMARKAPAAPRSQTQRAKERKTTEGDSCRPLL